MSLEVLDQMVKKEIKVGKALKEVQVLEDLQGLLELKALLGFKVRKEVEDLKGYKVLQESLEVLEPLVINISLCRITYENRLTVTF